ncbi:MAG: aminotransferase class V-fold PLP-dependent enzyme [Verrucomicrobiales bacterium]|nr:aminotransferase class V-fold PLP-dependent enzyme [Verrucomicrobiales bacterium]
MMSGSDGYFDYNATTPLRLEARQAWLEACERWWQNPSSLYRAAGAAARVLEEERESLAEQLGVEPARIVFNSGATEGNNAIMAHVAASAGRVAFSAVEHPSLREAARRWLPHEATTELPVEATGLLDLTSLSTWLRQNSTASLVSLMAANNESGSLQPWREAADLCAEAGVSFHCDATQWIGKEPLQGLAQCSWITLSAHKFGGPKGVGALVLPAGEKRLRWLAGGPQEGGHRAGTENLPAICAMGAALRAAEAERPQAQTSQAAARDAFEAALLQAFPDLRLIGADSPRLWNTSLFVMPRHRNLKWLTRLSEVGYSVSTGSACSSGREGSSVVLHALGASDEELRRVMRVSGGWHTPAQAWLDLAAQFVETSAALDQGGGLRRIQLGG